MRNVSLGALLFLGSLFLLLPSCAKKNGRTGPGVFSSKTGPDNVTGAPGRRTPLPAPPGGGASTTTALEGVWKTACLSLSDSSAGFSYYQYGFEVRGTSMQYWYAEFDEGGCDDNNERSEYRTSDWTFTVGRAVTSPAGATAIDFRNNRTGTAELSVYKIDGRVLCFGLPTESETERSTELDSDWPFNKQ